MAEIEEEDNFPNDFDGLDFDNIPGLQAPTSDFHEVSIPCLTVPAVLRNIIPSTVASPVPSIGSSSAEDMDSAFLAAVDALEARALSEIPQGGRTRDSKTFNASQDEDTSGPSQVHTNSMQAPALPAIDRKGKRKAEPPANIDVRAILSGYETELTCPICCDLLVGAQVANPCGHTCCGECGYGWLEQNRYEPTCAVCRTSLCTQTPLLPNFAVDGFVRQHLEVLARSGRPEWQERGYRTIEWNKRLESWKKQANDRAAKKKFKEIACLRRRQPRYYEVEDYPYVPPWVIGESVGMDDGLVPRAMRRGTRSRR